MRILICYCSTEGQTRKIARFCADQLFALGHSIEMLNASDAQELPLGIFDGVLLAGSVHAQKIQRELADFAALHCEALNLMPTLFLVVSLSAAGTDPKDWDGIRKIAREFSDTTGWTPGRVEHVAGAFRFSEYDFFRSLAMKLIASHRDETVTGQEDREYTDWAALSELVRSWSGDVADKGAKIRSEGQTTC